MTAAIVSTPKDYRVQEFDWGRLTWYVSGELKNSTTMTIGECLIHPGKGNPKHIHPNCDEVLHVLSGTIVHTMEGGREVKMSAGDTISIPATVPHCARNVGKTDAVLAISFSSAERQYKAVE